jgi:hypothetical protein
MVLSTRPIEVGGRSAGLFVDELLGDQARDFSREGAHERTLLEDGGFSSCRYKDR